MFHPVHLGGKYPGSLPRRSLMVCKSCQSPRYLRPFLSSNNGKFPANASGVGGGGGGEAYRGGGTRQSPTIPFGIVGALFPTTSLEIAVYNVRVHTQHVVIEVPERTSDIAQNQKLWKTFPTKNTSQHPWRGEEIRGRPGIKDLALSWWIGARFVDAGEICEHLCVGKQHRTNNEQQNRIKYPWIEPKLHRKSNNRPKFR